MSRDFALCRNFRNTNIIQWIFLLKKLLRSCEIYVFQRISLVFAFSINFIQIFPLFRKVKKFPSLLSKFSINFLSFILNILVSSKTKKKKMEKKLFPIPHVIIPAIKHQFSIILKYRVIRY